MEDLTSFEISETGGKRWKTLKILPRKFRNIWNPWEKNYEKASPSLGKSGKRSNLLETTWESFTSPKA